MMTTETPGPTSRVRRENSHRIQVIGTGTFEHPEFTLKSGWFLMNNPPVLTAMIEMDELQLA